MHEIISTLRDLWQTVHQQGFQGLGPLSYVLLALLVATEGPITTLIGAAGAAAGLLDIRFVFLATAIGNIVGDALWYSVGYASKMDRLHRITSRIGLHGRHVDRLEREMRSHATKAILLSKITFGLIIPTLVAAGLARVSLRKWLPAVLVAETVWTILLVSLGYRAAGAIAQVENGFRLIGLVAAAIVVASVVLYMKRHQAHLATDDVQYRPAARPSGGRLISRSQAAHRHLVHEDRGQHRRPRPAAPSSVRSSAHLFEKA